MQSDEEASNALYKSNEITSIGWLHAEGGNVTLTPCFNGASHPTRVNVTMAEYKATSGDKDLMKALAIKHLNK